MKISLRRTNKRARIPRAMHDDDACFDLFSVENIVIGPGETRVIDTGIQLAIPRGWEGQVRPRSGLAAKGITVANSPGTIDAGYRGNIKIIIHNNTTDVYHHVRPGDRIAQLAIRRVPTVVFEEVEELPDSERGDGGLGSTGM